MQIEKNFNDNIIKTVMDVPCKSTNNVKARLDMEELCARDELHICTRKNGNSDKQNGKYTLSVEQRWSFCEWLRQLSLSDGYSSNFGNKVNPSHTKLQNMKSHNRMYLWRYSF